MLKRHLEAGMAKLPTSKPGRRGPAPLAHARPVG